MDAPIISVLMPVYNAEKYVYEAIDSILKQTYRNFELLIFDDASTDSSKQIISSFHDPRIQLVSSAINTGYVKHLNDGLNLARGKYIARMDADDIAQTNRFQLQLSYLEQHQAVGVCGSWIEFIGDKVGVQDFPVCHRDIVTHLLLYGNAMAHPAVMIRKAVLDEHAITYDSSLEPAEDYDLWQRLVPYTQLHNIPQSLLKYRVHGSSESVLKKEKQDMAVRKIRLAMMAQWEIEQPKLVLDFLTEQSFSPKVDASELKVFRRFLKKILNAQSFDEPQVKSFLTQRFIDWCFKSHLSRYDKVIQYILFPKPAFSIRVCLSLFIQRHAR
jgi:glycosyltransferase involved in cell wall biosynthesis